MNEMKQAKQEYEEIVIPEELSGRVLETIERSAKKRSKVIGMRRRKSAAKGIAAAAAVFLVFTAAVNTSTAFAETVTTLPVIGALARLVTIQSYTKEENDINISVEIPSIEMIAENTGGLTGRVNQEIYERCGQYADEAVERAMEYKKAFLDTGGTKEEWEAHKIEIKVGYELKSQTDRYLSFVVTGSESWASAYSEAVYYTIDLSSGTVITLEDVLGADYIETANESIRKQMEERSAQGTAFWTEQEGGFSTISDKTRFYMNEAGNPVVVFDKYEIAPGAYGEIEFEIVKK